ncbi:chemotaxis protein CheB [Pseudomonas sp. HR96]|uniref:chemotaxis protein CheB n=1 Tax=Pseudomonas sp. HR96 TaxID=1027966 RepID=UPI002A760B08|nr:chemotaxis protein CheB [Pseudomonas sp. HR96]WPO98506.1 chemotaxis protein CheB [Pseudomonas sp. HR96]
MQARLASSAHKIIVIGASSGGEQAVQQILQALPGDLDASVLIALHPGCSMHTAWHDIGALPTRYAEHGDAILPGHVYIAPALRHLEVGPDLLLKLADPTPGLRPIPWADRLFLTAVSAFGKRVIGVVLTGHDSDGSQGMKAIHDAGGLGIVQEPSDAANPSMPLSSLRIDHPAYCLPLREIAEVLSELAGQTPDSMII